MASKTHQKLIILTLLTMTTLMFSAIADDQQLIDKLCGVTYDPALCKRCMKPSIKPNALTEADVLQTLLSNCADHDIGTLETDIIRIIDNQGTDDKTRKAMFDCQPPIRNVMEVGFILLKDVGERKFDAAQVSINTVIFPKLKDCDTVLENSGIKIPDLVSSGLFKVKAEYKIVFQILSSLM